ncbi:MAG TPA: SIMPL domain-containing protein [Eoetvoesiella sp.]
MYQIEQKRKWLLSVVFGAVVGMIAHPTFAHDEQTESISHEESKQPQASLNAQASAVVVQDTVKIILATEISDASQAKVNSALSKAVNSVMQEAKAGADSKVKVSSGNYRLWPFHDKNGKISSWQGRGEIVLESTDFAAASDLAGKLADRMPIASLDFSVSPQARARQEQALLTEAARAFRDRAQALTDAFGFSSYTIRNIDLGGAGAQYQPAPRMMAMAADKSSVPLEAGTEQVTLSVRGSIFLHSAQK